MANKISLAGVAGVCLLFAGAFFLCSRLLALIPGFDGLPGWAGLLLPSVLAFILAAGIGGGLHRRAGAISAICLLVALVPSLGDLLIASRKPVWEPKTPEAPAVPEDWAAFHFVSAFTNESSFGIGGLELELPWPHVGNWCMVGVPDANMQWTGMDPKDDRPWNRPETWFTKPEELGSNRYSRIVWLRIAIESPKGVEYEMRLENENWTVPKGGRYLEFLGVEEPYQNENILAKACLRMWSGEFVVRDSLGPKETVVVEGVFLVPRENENDVSLGDLATEGFGWLPEENRWMWPNKPSEARGPVIGVSAPGGGRAERVVELAMLERWELNKWRMVEKFTQTPENLALYTWDVIDRVA
jgi:hypothetical protein